MAAAFTCGICGESCWSRLTCSVVLSRVQHADTRTVKRFSRQSYERGVVIARCPSCETLHLISDRLGWFGKPGSIDDFLTEQGQGV